MSDYIKRDDALNIDFKIIVRAFENRKTTATNAVQAYADEIAKIPSEDVRPVVLCRDCKHSDTFAPDCTEATFPLKCLSIRYGGVYPNWFCEHGEMREES